VIFLKRALILVSPLIVGIGHKSAISAEPAIDEILNMILRYVCFGFFAAQAVCAQDMAARNLTDLRASIAASVDQGLNPADYGFEPIEAALAKGADADWLSIMVRDRALHLARDIVFGHAPHGHSHDNDADPSSVIDDALSQGELAAALRNLQPTAPDYAALVAELARQRLQKDAAKINALRATLERWRWLPRSLPADRLWVDLPFYQLTLLRSGEPPQVHDVIIGKSEHPTEIFSTQVKGVIYDPAWQPPERLIRESVIPAIRAGRGEALGYQLLKNGIPVPLKSLDWRGRSSLPAGYSLRQLPGPKNALGAVKLDMPNPFSIYLHDTPNKDLFGKQERALSNGCVRVKDALGLVERLVGAPTKSSSRVVLAQPLMLYIVYMTARVQSDAVHYAPDVYKLDASLIKTLDDEKASKLLSIGADTDCVS
jgi:L,D-transpeptidase YcbB